MIIRVIIFIILVIASIEDIRKREVSNITSLFILILGLINMFIYREPIKLLGLIICPMILILINMKQKGAFGGGDIKMIGALGLNLGIRWGVMLLLTTLILDTIYKKIKRVKSVPLMPFILISYIIVQIL